MINIFSRIFTLWAVFHVYKNIRYQRLVKRWAEKWREINYKIDDIKFEWIPNE